MFAYDKTIDPKVVVVGNFDLISWFSDFVLYLGTQLLLIYMSILLSSVCLRMTRPLTLK